MNGLLVVAAVVVYLIAGYVLYLHDVAQARAEHELAVGLELKTALDLVQLMEADPEALADALAVVRSPGRSKHWWQRLRP